MSRKGNVMIGLILGILALTSLVGMGADVVINEVAWAGTAAGSSDEWIELRNQGEAAVDLTGWTIMLNESEIPLGEVAGATSEVRRTTIEAGGYFLLERTDDTTVSDIEADVIYRGTLANDGALLELRDAAGAMIDRVDTLETGWPAGAAGDGDPAYASMERRTSESGDAIWCTNDGQIVNGLDAAGGAIVGTPRQANGCGILAASAPRLQLLSPDEEDLVGTVVIEWTAEDPDGTAEELRISIEVSSDGGDNWLPVATNLANAGGYAWDTSAFADGDEYVIRLTAEDADGYRARVVTDAFAICNDAT